MLLAIRFFVNMASIGWWTLHINGEGHYIQHVDLQSYVLNMPRVEHLHYIIFGCFI